MSKKNISFDGILESECISYKYNGKIVSGKIKLIFNDRTFGPKEMQIITPHGTSCIYHWGCCFNYEISISCKDSDTSYSIYYDSVNQKNDEFSISLVLLEFMKGIDQRLIFRKIGNGPVSMSEPSLVSEENLESNVVEDTENNLLYSIN